MKLEPVKMRFCKAMACTNLDKAECKAEECQHPNVTQALVARRIELKAVKVAKAVQYDA